MRRDCPFCTDGVLPVQRDQRTMRVRSTDRCMGCGQQVVYTDCGLLAGMAQMSVNDLVEWMTDPDPGMRSAAVAELAQRGSTT